MRIRLVELPAETMIDAAHRMGGLIMDLLAFAQIVVAGLVVFGLPEPAGIIILAEMALLALCGFVRARRIEVSAPRPTWFGVVIGLALYMELFPTIVNPVAIFWAASFAFFYLVTSFLRR